MLINNIPAYLTVCSLLTFSLIVFNQNRYKIENETVTEGRRTKLCPTIFLINTGTLHKAQI